MLLIYGISIDRHVVIGTGILSFILLFISIKRMPTLISDFLLMQLMVTITIILSMFVYIQISPCFLIIAPEVQGIQKINFEINFESRTGRNIENI